MSSNTPQLSFRSCSKVSAIFSNCYLLIFLSKKLLHCLRCWLKQCITKWKMISEDIITDTVTCRSFNFLQFSVFMYGNIEYVQVLLIQRRFSQLQINSPVMASIHIYKLKINAKLQEKTCEVR